MIIIFMLYSYVANCTYLSEQFSKTFVTLQINGKLHSCIKVNVNSFINYVINMISYFNYVATYVANI